MSGIYERVEGMVYCYDHGKIHKDLTDPDGTGGEECYKEDHRLVYFRTRKGDFQ